MIYSSGRYDKLTADRYPWQAHWPDGGKGGRYAEDVSQYVNRTLRYAPRPEYDRPLTNPANPILTGYREAVKRGDLFADPESWLNNLEDMAPDSDAWGHAPEQIDHARRVLERLAALKESE